LIETDQPRNIVILCDGTGNEISENISNVLKLYRCLRKKPGSETRQIVYYDPGVGTLSRPSTWHKWRQDFNAILGLATGYGLDDNVLSAYQFLVNTWREGDRIYLFGFSRGAYTVRVLAGLIHKVGLIAPEQVNLAGFGLIAYKQFSSDAPSQGLDLNALTDAGSDRDGPLPTSKFDNAAQFARITGSRWPDIDFVGVWDTVASVIVPRPDRYFWPSLEELAFTIANPSVKVFRQAISIDERRSMFRLDEWDDPQDCVSQPSYGKRGERTKHAGKQDILQVWFAGVHGDVGGGYPETQSAIAKYPLIWMIDQAVEHGLAVKPWTVRQLAWGIQRPNPKFRYVAPDYKADAHDSMNFAWRLLECVPKRTTYKEWPARKSLFGFYIPCKEPRVIPEGAVIHESVVKRIAEREDYEPVNMPKTFTTFPMPTQPPPYEAGA
jgi:uncharacterized protein (DUF2235 family)